MIHIIYIYIYYYNHYDVLYLFLCSSIIPLTCPLHLSGWLAARSARLFLDKSYRYNLLSILGEDPPTDIDMESMNTARRKALAKQSEGVAFDVSKDGVEVCEGLDEKDGNNVSDLNSPGKLYSSSPSEQMEVEQRESAQVSESCRADASLVEGTEGEDNKKDRTKELTES